MAHTILYIATSKDGFIADANGGLDWLPQEAPEGQDFGFDEFLHSIDVIAQGSRTFLQTLSFIEDGLVEDLPYGGKHMYVFTHKPMSSDRADVTFVHSIAEYLKLLNKDQTIKRVWLLGGAELVRSFKDADLIDECIITQIPVEIKAGIALPAHLYDDMQEVATKELYDGIIEKKYVRNK